MNTLSDKPLNCENEACGRSAGAKTGDVEKCVLPQDGAVRWSLQLQCKLVGDGHEGWVSFANKLNEVCGAGAVQHLGDLHASELTVIGSELTVPAQPVLDKKGFSELA